MSSVQQQIEYLEEQLEYLRKQAEVGYEVKHSSYDEFNVYTGHTSIYDLDGNLAGVIINTEIIKKYFVDIEEEIK